MLVAMHIVLSLSSVNDKRKPLFLYCDCAVVGNDEAVIFDVIFGKGANVLSSGVGVVLARSLVTILNEGVNLAVEKLAVLVETCYQQWSIGRLVMQLHAAWSGKVAQAVGDEVAVV